MEEINKPLKETQENQEKKIKQVNQTVQTAQDLKIEIEVIMKTYNLHKLIFKVVFFYFFWVGMFRSSCCMPTMF